MIIFTISKALKGEQIMEQKIDERLQKAAEYYAEHYSSNKDAALSAYIAGAQWQRNSIWHDVNEELPIVYRHVLLYTEEDTVIQGRYNGWDWDLSMWFPKCLKILKWCYLSDIIPHLSMITKRYEYWSREGKKWTDWFEWDSDYCPELQLTDRRISSRLKNEYK